MTHPPGAAAAIADAIEAEIARLTAERDALAEALRPLVVILDDLAKESGRSIKRGEEDPFRMGEWFDADDLALIERARAALARLAP